VRSLLVLALGGCYVPLGTAPAPIARTTAGGAGLTVSGEYPALELSTLPVTPPDPAGPHRYPKSRFVPILVQLALGVSRRVDVEIGSDLILPLIPVPNGANAGVRVQVLDGETFEATVAARGGFLRRRSSHDELVGEVTVTAGYLALGAAARWKTFLKPAAALNLQPVYAHFRDGEPLDDLLGASAVVALGVTLPIGRLEILPTGWVGGFTSNNVRGFSPYAGVGLAFVDRR
jgi:hypothetical protein